MIEKIIVNTIPEAWERDFEVFDGPKVTTIQQVQTILQKIECCENLERQTEKKKDNLQKSFKNNEFKKKLGKYQNPCKKPGHDHEWDDCPENWKNKKKAGDDKQENTQY